MTERIQRPVLHITHDGILQPIGFSQVVRPILGLASRGIPHVLVSLERSCDIADRGHVEAVQRRLEDAGVIWKFARYLQGSAHYLENTAMLAACAAKVVLDRGTSVIHARGFPVAPTALALHAVTGAPILYDTRGFWIDQRIESDRIFRSRSVVSLARRLEALIYRRSAAVVSLTQLGLDIIRTGRFGTLAPENIGVCIPTCVDYKEFSPHIEAQSERIPQEIRAQIQGQLVLGFVGSVNQDYRVPEMLRLFRYVRARRSDAMLLCLTEQGELLRRLATEEGVQSDAMIVHRVHHEEMPAWLAQIDWGLLFLVERFAKSASMPTKLGEFFASGVRPLFHGCNAEVRTWVERAGSGHVLPDLSDASLRAAADVVASSATDTALLQAARERTYDHFSLASGIARYEAILRSLSGPDSERAIS